jgi:hypothetical protein
MAKSSHAADNAKIAAAALRSATNLGWNKVTLESVAKGMKVPLATLKARFATTAHLVPVIAEEIDREAFASVGNPSGPPHDMLFDLLMARFDVMQRNRKAILSMAEAARYDGVLARSLACAGLSSLYRFIDRAKLNAPPRPALAAGLATIYGYAFWVWRQDYSRDMAKTMAAVDRALRYAEKAATLLKQRA